MSEPTFAEGYRKAQAEYLVEIKRMFPWLPADVAEVGNALILIRRKEMESGNA
jgi:hypothetical protein